MNPLKSILAAAALSVLASSAFAQTSPAATPGIDKRVETQEKRIDQGVKSGELTKREAARLEKREAKIQSDVAKAKADGVVTTQERKHLNRELNHQSKAIHREKHDGQHDLNHDGKRDRKGHK